MTQDKSPRRVRRRLSRMKSDDRRKYRLWQGRHDRWSDRAALGESLFERLAGHNPLGLVRLLEPGKLPPHLLTYAAEIAGRSLRAELVVAPLLRLLDASAQVVREGAIYGLSSHDGDPRVIARLTELARIDPSPGVRMAAGGVVEDSNEVER